MILPKSTKIAALILCLAPICLGTTAALAQQGGFEANTELLSDRNRLNTNTVGIMSGKTDSTYLTAVEDMVSVLDNGYELRIIAMIGKGAIQNIQDVISLQNTDMGVTQANVLSYLKKRPNIAPNIAGRLRYVAKLFNEEVHVVASSAFNSLSELSGQTVNVGETGSGTQLTAQLIFEALGIPVKAVNMVQSDALVAVNEGRIAATVMVTGKPSPIFDIVRLKGLKLLPVPYEEALEAEYLPARFTHQDYPSLVADGSYVDTVAIPAVLAVFNWKAGTDRYRRVAKFVDAFFGKFEEFRKAPRHPKWREVNLAADLPGWERFSASQEWLAKNAKKADGGQAAGAAAAGADPQKRTFMDFLAAQNQTGGTAKENEALFKEFLAWRKSQSGAAAAPAAPAAPAARTPAAATAPASKPSPGERLW